jgi:uncharacterized membrane protein
MKTTRTPLIMLVVLYLAFVGYLAFCSAHLPDPVATHFNGHGKPDGWMSRSSHLLLMGAAGLVLPLVIVGAMNAIRLFPSGLNIPRKEFWLSPERRQQTFGFLSRQALWFACVCVVFILGLQVMLVQANAQTPVQLSMPRHFVLAGGFLAFAAIWSIVTIRRFYRTS